MGWSKRGRYEGAELLGQLADCGTRESEVAKGLLICHQYCLSRVLHAGLRS